LQYVWSGKNNHNPNIKSVQTAQRSAEKNDAIKAAEKEAEKEMKEMERMERMKKIENSNNSFRGEEEEELREKAEEMLKEKEIAQEIAKAREEDKENDEGSDLNQGSYVVSTNVYGGSSWTGALRHPVGIPHYLEVNPNMMSFVYLQHPTLWDDFGDPAMDEYLYGLNSGGGKGTRGSQPKYIRVPPSQRHRFLLSGNYKYYADLIRKKKEIAYLEAEQASLANDEVGLRGGLNGEKGGGYLMLQLSSLEHWKKYSGHKKSALYHQMKYRRQMERFRGLRDLIWWEENSQPTQTDQSKQNTGEASRIEKKKKNCCEKEFIWGIRATRFIVTANVERGGFSDVARGGL